MPGMSAATAQKSTEQVLSPSPNEVRAKESIIQVLKATSDWLVISTGNLDAKIYAQPDLKAELEKAVKRSVRVQVFVGPTPDALSLQKLPFLESSIYVLEDPPRLHFAVGDGLHVRYEGEHNSPQTPRNCFRLNAPDSAQELLAEVYNYTESGKLLPLAAWQRQTGSRND